jgi:hypothetical protein
MTSVDESNYASRRQAFLEYAADAKPGGGRGGFFSQLCRLELNRGPIDEDSVRASLEHVNERRDCSDFSVCGLLRLCHQYADSTLLSPELLQEIHTTLIEFKYWVDEPGHDLMFFWTENHQIMFHSGEYLAGQLFPDTVFPNAELTGKQHQDKARTKLLSWIDLKARIGFSEWDSNCYYDEDIAPLLNLVDFASDPEVQHRAKMLLDVMFFDMAVDSFQGVYGTSHGRTYPRHLLKGHADAMATARKLAWNRAEFSSPSNMTAVCLSTSRRYRVPEIIEKIAQDVTEECTNKERHSFELSDAESLGIRADDPEKAMPIWGAGMFANRQIVDQTLKLADQFQSGCFDVIIRPYVQAVLKAYDALDAADTPHDGDLDRRTLSEVNKLTYRTPDYQLSCAQDYRKGKLGFQQHIWQATLAPEASVFTLHRGSEDNEGMKYWQGRLPRAVQTKNCVIAIYDIPELPLPGPATEFPPEAGGKAIPSPAPSEETLLPYTLASFPRAAFDEIAEQNGWIFARKNNGYLALRSQQPTEWTPDGIFDTEGLIAAGRQNIWICQLGRTAIDGAFDAWCGKIAQSSVTFDHLSVSYRAPDHGDIQFGWRDPLTVNGEEIPLRGYPRFGNPYCHTEHNSGIYDIQHDGQSLHLDFTPG